MFIIGMGAIVSFLLAVLVGLIVGTGEYGAICGLIWGVITFIIGVLISCFIAILPIKGYHKTEVETTKLLPLRRKLQEDKAYYLEKCGKKVTYAMNACDKYSLNGISYREVTLKRNVEICETEGCTYPMLKSFITKPKRDEDTISNFFTKKKYVLCIPVGTVHNKNEVKKTDEQQTKKIHIDIQ